MDPRLHVDSDIAKARTLPSVAYFDPSLYELALERVFVPSWQPAGDVARLKAPGHVVPFTLLPGSLDEELVLTKPDDGRVRCLSNVCTHRGTVVVEGEGHVQTLRCRYHGRRFDLEGRMKFMPEFEETADFPSPSDDLPALPLHEWGPLFFTSLEPACDFEEWIRPVRERVDWLRPERFRRHEAHSTDYLIQASWAMYCDNYLEGFHLPYVHAASLGDKLDYEGYHTELFEWSNVQIGVAKEGEPAFELPRGHPDDGKRIAAWYFWLYPNVMLNLYPWGLSLNVVQPLGPGRTRVLFRSYVHDESKLLEGAGAALHRVEMEDEEIVESAQRGMRSRLYDRGRYSPKRERGPHHFHTLLARALAGILLVLLWALAPADAGAQVRRGRPVETGPGWAPVTVGVRLGLNRNPDGELVGGHAHVPIIPSGKLEIAGAFDAIYVRGTRDYQYELAAFYVHGGGPRGGPYLGGAIGRRRSQNASLTEPRRTLDAYSAIVGIRSGPGSFLRTYVEARYTWLSDADLEPSAISIGVALPLWRNTPTP